MLSGREGGGGDWSPRLIRGNALEIANTDISVGESRVGVVLVACFPRSFYYWVGDRAEVGGTEVVLSRFQHTSTRKRKTHTQHTSAVKKKKLRREKTPQKKKKSRVLEGFHSPKSPNPTQGESPKDTGTTGAVSAKARPVYGSSILQIYWKLRNNKKKLTSLSNAARWSPFVRPPRSRAWSSRGRRTALSSPSRSRCTETWRLLWRPVDFVFETTIMGKIKTEGTSPHLEMGHRRGSMYDGHIHAAVLCACRWG